jgi:hypothetical protein
MTETMENGQFAVSTWSLHRLLGATYPYSPDPAKSAAAQEPYGPGSAALIDIPKHLPIAASTGWKSARSICRALIPVISGNCARHSTNPASCCRRCWSKMAIRAIRRPLSAISAGSQTGSTLQRPSAPETCASSRASSSRAKKTWRVRRGICPGWPSRLTIAAFASSPKTGSIFCLHRKR